jgi:hypothetical protein
MGFLNFCFSLGLSLLLMSFLLKKKLSVNIFVLSAILLIIYLSHFIGLALIVLFMLVYCFHYKKYSESLKILPAFLPIMILFIHYLVTKNISNLLPSPITNSFRVLAESKLLSTFSVIIPFNKYKWLSEPSLLLIGADLFFCIFITVAACYSLYEAWNKNKWNINVFLGLLLLPLIVGAPAYFGGMLNPGTRLVLFLELNIFILFLNHNYIIFPRKVILFVVIAFTLGAYSYNIHNAYQFDKQLQGGVIPLDAILRSRSLFEGTDGYLHLSFYHGITHHEALRPFRTGMLDYPPDETGVSSGNKPYK